MFAANHVIEEVKVVLIFTTFLFAFFRKLWYNYFRKIRKGDLI